MSQNNETAAMFVSQSSPVGVELFSYVNASGPNCKKIEQQLEEIRQEIKALRENKTTGSGNGKGL